MRSASQARALAAIESGFLSKQIVPVEVPDGRSTRVFDTDESPREGITIERLAKLRPAFQEGGKVTAGNSSGVTDGAGAMLVGTRESMEANTVLCRRRVVVDWTVVGVPPSSDGAWPRSCHRKTIGENRADDSRDRLL